MPLAELCKFAREGDQMVCINPGCGRRVCITEPSLTADQYYATCLAYGEQPEAPRPILLGDRIESALSSIGITKELWGNFTKQHGDPPVTGCAECDERQEEINAADLWMRNAAAELGEAATAVISKFWAPISWLKKRSDKPVQSGISRAQPPTMDSQE